MPHTESPVKLRAALVGTGAMGREHLKCLREHPGVRIVGICDRVASLAEVTADEFDVPRWFVRVDEMLAEERPDVVHITTPAASHHPLARQALSAGAHVFVEKPVTCQRWELGDLARLAAERNLWVIEDQNYLFNDSCQELLRLVRSGEAGEVCHVEIAFQAAILGPGSPFADPNMPHPSTREPGGIISDFLPHLAYLARAFVGPHRSVHARWRRRLSNGPGLDEVAALVDAEQGSASLFFSASAQPNGFWIRVRGSRLTAEADLFEPRLIVARNGGPAALLPTRNNVAAARSHAAGAARSLTHRFAGRAMALDGMWTLIDRTYRALAAAAAPPIAMDDLAGASRLAGDLAATCDGAPA
jgi:predicted dehydrogenase